MREMEFKMERQGLVEVGQEVQVSEGIVGSNYYYTILPAVAMSGNFKYYERLKSKSGIVKNIEQTDRGYFIIMEFDE